MTRINIQNEMHHLTILAIVIGRNKSLVKLIGFNSGVHAFYNVVLRTGCMSCTWFSNDCQVTWDWVGRSSAAGVGAVHLGRGQAGRHQGQAGLQP